MTTLTPGLRARRREELIAAVRAAATAELARTGPTALSLRAVAREVGIAVSALYRYFPSRDDLLTDLIVSGYDEQADAMEAAADAASDPVAGLRAALLEYRAWALRVPASFALLYGTPVADYRAPAGETVRAGSRVGHLMVRLLAEAQTCDLLDLEQVRARGMAMRPETADQLRALAQRHHYALAPEVIALGVDALVRVHGLVIMELFGQLRPVTPDAGPYAHELVDAEVARFTRQPSGEAGASA